MPEGDIPPSSSLSRMSWRLMLAMNTVLRSVASAVLWEWWTLGFWSNVFVGWRENMQKRGESLDTF
jgi:hypothetical protein